jgi:hypothetical protein
VCEFVNVWLHISGCRKRLSVGYTQEQRNYLRATVKQWTCCDQNLLKRDPIYLPLVRKCYTLKPITGRSACVFFKARNNDITRNFSSGRVFPIVISATVNWKFCFPDQ